MLKSLCMLTVFFTTSLAQAGLLSCYSNGQNPYYNLIIEKDTMNSRFLGNFEEVINGYTGISKKFLGRNPLSLKLNPSTCELSIVLQNNSASAFKITLPLNDIEVKTGYGSLNKKFDGKMSGSIFGSSKVTCSNSDSDLIRGLQEICNQNASIDNEVLFSSTVEIMSLISNGSTSNIERFIQKDSILPDKHSKHEQHSSTVTKQ